MSQILIEMDQVNNETTSVGGRIINPDLYKAASEGNIEPFKECNNGPLEDLATPIKNTILHIYIATPNKTDEKATGFVEQILEICPSLLRKCNESGDTGLHLAAKLGHFAVVEALIEAAKASSEDVEGGGEDLKLWMLREKNNLGNTALHEAVQNCYSHMLELLTKEDPHYSYSANNSGESPLFIAAECRSLRMVDIILENCESASHEGPNKKTALHVAVRSNNLDITRKLLSKKIGLTKETDDYGWTPLHYAAYYGHFSIVQYLLECDGCVAFAADKERQMTPLHLAAGQGYVNIMEEIISCRPDCWQMVDVRGWNFLHFAFTALPFSGMTAFLRRNSKVKNVIQNLINAKDIEGNTPLHVYAVCQPSTVLILISRRKNEVRGDALNKENDTILGTHWYGSPKLQKEIEELKVVGKVPYRKGIIRCKSKQRRDFISRMQEGRDAQLVVVALIATVTFAAALTSPGGFDQGKGSSILRKKAAFQAFIITDAIAMILSLFAIFVHFFITLEPTQYGYMFAYTNYSTLLALIAMVIAFVTGTYAVLTPSLGLAVGTIFIGLSFFALLLGLAVVEMYRGSH